MESQGKGLEHERKRIESQKQERIKNKNKSWKKNITLFDFSIQSVSKQCS